MHFFQNVMHWLSKYAHISFDILTSSKKGIQIRTYYSTSFLRWQRKKLRNVLFRIHVETETVRTRFKNETIKHLKIGTPFNLFAKNCCNLFFTILPAVVLPKMFFFTKWMWLWNKFRLIARQYPSLMFVIKLAFMFCPLFALLQVIVCWHRPFSGIILMHTSQLDYIKNSISTGNWVSLYK